MNKHVNDTNLTNCNICLVAKQQQLLQQQQQQQLQLQQQRQQQLQETHQRLQSNNAQQQNENNNIVRQQMPSQINTITQPPQLNTQNTNQTHDRSYHQQINQTINPYNRPPLYQNKIQNQNLDATVKIKQLESNIEIVFDKILETDKKTNLLENIVIEINKKIEIDDIKVGTYFTDLNKSVADRRELFDNQFKNYEVYVIDKYKQLDNIVVELGNRVSDLAGKYDILDQQFTQKNEQLTKQIKIFNKLIEKNKNKGLQLYEQTNKLETLNKQLGEYSENIEGSNNKINQIVTDKFDSLLDKKIINMLADNNDLQALIDNKIIKYLNENNLPQIDNPVVDNKINNLIDDKISKLFDLRMENILTQINNAVNDKIIERLANKINNTVDSKLDKIISYDSDCRKNKSINENNELTECCNQQNTFVNEKCENDCGAHASIEQKLTIIASSDDNNMDDSDNFSELSDDDFDEQIKLSKNVISTMAEQIIKIEPIVEPTVEPIVEPTVEPTVVPTAELVAVPTAELVAEPTVMPTIVPIVEPSVESIIKPVIEPTVELVTEPIVEPAVELIINSLTKSLVESIDKSLEPLLRHTSASASESDQSTTDADDTESPTDPANLLDQQNNIDDKKKTNIYSNSRKNKYKHK